MQKIVVTGGAGFIGSHFVDLLLQQTDSEVLTIDALTYAGSLKNLPDHPRHRFVQADITDVQAMHQLLSGVDAVVNFAAESHVDRSISNPARFIETNVLGTQILLDAARVNNVRRFVQISTDEVYGELGESGMFTEDTPLSPSSPYSASKAAGDLLVLAWARTYHMDALITRCSNNYGPRQYPEKLIPVVIQAALQNKPVPVYGKGQNVRDWIHVRDHCKGVLAALKHGQAGRVYNFGGRCEKRNLELVQALLKAMGKPESLICFVQDRPGHDWRYANDCSRAEAELGWRSEEKFEQGLLETIEWYREFFKLALALPLP
jgi:dTDP-glucose 4,6-dehydratase